jgi:hypothetical protein
VKANKSSFKSEGLQQLTHNNKLEKMELRKADSDLFGSGKQRETIVAHKEGETIATT